MVFLSSICGYPYPDLAFCRIRKEDFKSFLTGNTISLQAVLALEILDSLLCAGSEITIRFSGQI